MKRDRLIYWVATILTLVMMMIASISGLMKTEQGVQLFKHLGYPEYLITFLGVARLLGVIAILIPGYPRLKEWAYAGFCFDLVGAAASGLAVGDPVSLWIPVYIEIIILFISYVYYHKLLKARAGTNRK